MDPRPKEIENLIKAGCLRGFGSIPHLLTQIQQQDWRLGQPRLFEISDSNEQADWDLHQKVTAQEAILGIGINSHPVNLAVDQIKNLDTVTTLEALSRLDEKIRVAGIRQTAQRFHRKDSGSFYIVELDDAHGVLPVKMTTDFYRQHKKWLSSRVPFLVEGVIGNLSSTKEAVLISEKLTPLKPL